jgi:hypothetical protein
VSSALFAGVAHLPSLEPRRAVARRPHGRRL